MTGPTDTDPPPTRPSLGGSDDPAYYEALGRAIRVLRTERGMERKDLAEAAGLSYAYLSEIETGKKRGSSKALYVIAEALGVRPSEILVLGDRYAAQPPAGSPVAASRMTAAGAAAPDLAQPIPAPASAPPRPMSVGAPAPARADSAPTPIAAQRAPGSGRWQWFQREAPVERAATTSDAGQPDPRAALLEQLAAAAANLSHEDVETLLELARRLER